MRWFILSVALLSGCGDEGKGEDVNPVLDCSINQSDCCETDSQCGDVYGHRLGFCNRDTQVCEPCVADDDCDAYGLKHCAEPFPFFLPDEEHNVCLECLEDSDCSDGETCLRDGTYTCG